MNPYPDIPFTPYTHAAVPGYAALDAWLYSKILKKALEAVGVSMHTDAIMFSHKDAQLDLKKKLPYLTISKTSGWTVSLSSPKIYC
jgi:hypothetical protein